MSDTYQMARSEGAVVRRPDAGLVELTGPQRVWFLQNTVTADVEDIEVGTWRGSFFLTPKGKVIAHFRVGVLEDRIVLDVEPSATAQLVDWFVRYRFRTKVEVDDRTTGRFTVLGPPAPALVEPGHVVADGDHVAFGDAYGDIAIADVHAAELPSQGLAEADEDLFEVVRIEAGIPRFGVDYGQDNLPQESGMSTLVPVDKGCYVGQETVARIHFRGHVNKVVRTLRLDGVDAGAAPGRSLTLDGERVGEVTSAVASPRLGLVALGMVRVAPPEGATLELEGGGTAELGPVPAGTKT